MHGLVVIGHLVVKIGPVTKHSDAERLLPGDPLVHRPGAVVEVPGNDQPHRVRAQRVQAIEHDAGFDAGHDGAGYTEFCERYATCVGTEKTNVFTMIIVLCQTV